MAREVKPRVHPPVAPAEVRRRNFGEVIGTITFEQAVAEAQRCLLCKNPRCQTACPLQNQLPRWIGELQQGRVAEAYRIIRETSPMPELCCRLCPQERLCEGSCALGIKHEPVAIGPLERFVAEEGGRLSGDLGGPRTPSTGIKRVAVVGSGPAGLAVAQRMAREGHHVSVFERSPDLGGVLRWIPRFKLPMEALESHLEMLKRLGVKFYANTEVRWLEELLAHGYDAVFVGIGASRPAAPQLPGGELGGILSSTEFLVRVFYDASAMPNDWEPIGDLIGKRVVVLGGGDSAMDCVRTAIRLGSKEVSCIYRRDEANMPGSKKEVKAAKEEGANLVFLASPLAFHSSDGERVSEVACVRMELAEPDAKGRRSVKVIPGSEFRAQADLVVLAFGYEVEPIVEEHLVLMCPPKGTVKVNPATGATPMPGVFAGGDCVTGPSLVSTAARAGLVACEGMLRHFAGEPWERLAPQAAQPVAAS